jgi:Tol biopolymer transport system component
MIGDGEFAAPTPVTNVNGEGGLSDDAQPSVTGDGTRLFFRSDRDDDAYDLYVSIRDGASFSEPAPLSMLNSAEVYDSYPVIRSDGLELYFASSRPEPMGAGSLDIWVARRNELDEEFSAAAKVDELTTSRDDAPSWISPDGCTLYFLRYTSGAGGEYETWVAHKPAG